MHMCMYVYGPVYHQQSMIYIGQSTQRGLSVAQIIILKKRKIDFGERTHMYHVTIECQQIEETKKKTIVMCHFD